MASNGTSTTSNGTSTTQAPKPQLQPYRVGQASKCHHALGSLYCSLPHNNQAQQAAQQQP